MNILALSLLLTTALFSCKNSSKKEDDKKTVDSLKPVTSEITPPIDSANLPLIVRAKFEEFTLGDASHYMFKDEDGKEWDFAEDHDSTYKFSVELPKSKSNESNQGWGSNKALQGKWFKITYAYRNLQQYEGGPIVKAPFIISVKPGE